MVNNLRKFFVAISLMVILSGTVLADCPQPNASEQNGPPCAPSQQRIDDSADQVSSAAAIANAVEVVVLDVLFVDGLENLLTVY
jgi:hypothetical protein